VEAVVAFLAWLSLATFLAVFVGGFAGASGKSTLEDQAQYECFNPGVRPVSDVLSKQALDAAILEEKQLRSVQTTDPSTTAGKKPGRDLGDTIDLPGFASGFAIRRYSRRDW
jgi:hypothetical protein